MSENIEKAPNVPPFVTFVTSAVPMVFDNSLSYYEALCALWKWLQDDVVNVINNNATVTEDYIQLTNEMKEYMDNYFDNLDVQEEINNKLDAMVEEGTLQEIITTYIQANTAWCFDSVAEMLASTNFIDGSFAQTFGFYSKNDGGNALYKIREITNDDTVNNITLFSVTGDPTDTLVAELIMPSKLSILACGAKNDGSTDTSSILNFLITNYNEHTIFVPNGDYLLNSTVKLKTATKIEGENKWKTRFFTNSTIVMFENDEDDIAVCSLSNLWIDGNDYATKGIFLYRDNPHLVYNDSRTELRSLMIKKCSDWCLQIGDPAASSNVIEVVADDIYVHQFTGGGIYISKCSDSHFSNLRAGGGLSTTKPCIQVEGYNLQIVNSKAFLAGTTSTPVSGWVFNGGVNIIADIEAQANTKHGVELKNTKDSQFSIIADKNSYGSTYSGILIDSVQDCIVNANISNNVTAAGFDTTTGCKLVEPKKLTLNLQTAVSVTKILDLSQYNTNQISSVNADINVNGYDITDVTPAFSESITAPAGVTITKIGDGKYHVSGSVTSDQNVWFAGSYGQHTMLTKIYDGYTYSLSTKNKDIGMSVWNYVTNLGGGRCAKFEGATNEITAVALTLKGNVTFDCIIEPKILACPNTWLTA